jgi:hypothetical protein
MPFWHTRATFTLHEDVFITIRSYLEVTFAAANLHDSAVHTASRAAGAIWVR